MHGVSIVSYVVLCVSLAGCRGEILGSMHDLLRTKLVTCFLTNQTSFVLYISKNKDLGRSKIKTDFPCFNGSSIVFRRRLGSILLTDSRLLAGQFILFFRLSSDHTVTNNSANCFHAVLQYSSKIVETETVFLEFCENVLYLLLSHLCSLKCAPLLPHAMLSYVYFGALRRLPKSTLGKGKITQVFQDL